MEEVKEKLNCKQRELLCKMVRRLNFIENESEERTTRAIAKDLHEDLCELVKILVRDKKI